MFIQVSYNFGGMGLQITDGLDPAGQFHGSASIFLIMTKYSPKTGQLSRLKVSGVERDG